MYIVLFKDHCPDEKIRFKQFCELCPKYYVFLGPEEHAAHVCTIHQNAKLIMAQCKMSELTYAELSIKTYKDVTSNIICKTPSYKYYFASCVMLITKWRFEG